MVAAEVYIGADGTLFGRCVLGSQVVPCCGQLGTAAAGALRCAKRRQGYALWCTSTGSASCVAGALTSPFGVHPVGCLPFVIAKMATD